MAKKIFYLLVIMCSLLSSAQNAVGDWRIHTSFVGNEVTTVAEGNNWVYYLSGAHLFRLDKQTQENEALNKLNLLSDMMISNIYYNPDKDYIVVVYSNANIDIIRSDGSVVNMPEIKNAVMTSSKTVNDVTFAPGKIYLATAFGYVVIDDTKFVVEESHFYTEALTSVAQAGDLLLISTASRLYYGDANEYHDQLSTFNATSSMANCRMRVIDEQSFFSLMSDKTSLAQMDLHDNGTVSFNTQNLYNSLTTDVQKTHGGYLLNVPGDSVCYKTNEAGLDLESIDTDGEVCSSHPSGDGTLASMWAGGPDGLHLLGSQNYYLPNAMTMPQPFWMTYNKERDMLYVSSSGTNAFFENNAYPIQVNTYDGMKWTDVTPEGAPNHRTRGSYWIEFMPGDPDTYLMGTWRNGLLKVKDNKVIYTYDPQNSPMLDKYAIHPVTSVDRNGNVWVVEPLYNEEHPVMVLSAAKAKQSEVTTNDWITPSIDGIFNSSSKRASFISTRNSNQDIKVFTDGDYQRPLFVWNSGGEISSRPQQVSFDRPSDQDGQIISWTHIMCLTEDLSGYVWVGTTEGIFMFNPLAALSGSSVSVIRPKVPRDDGTGFADRLMDGIQVNDVAVDGANRKWIATQSTGLFLVNSDGTQIIKKFNTTNSPLATNTIYKVCCNPNGNSVYVTTPSGLYEYFSDSSPAASNYNDIYAYPNPVRPDYAGEVTIVGLMDNSLVKIADASGQVIKQLKSTGGMVTWDCCDDHGNSVKTGVYLVLCSQANGGNEAVVTKVAIIR